MYFMKNKKLNVTCMQDVFFSIFPDVVMLQKWESEHKSFKKGFLMGCFASSL